MTQKEGLTTISTEFINSLEKFEKREIIALLRLKQDSSNYYKTFTGDVLNPFCIRGESGYVDVINDLDGNSAYLSRNGKIVRFESIEKYTEIEEVNFAKISR